MTLDLIKKRCIVLFKYSLLLFVLLIISGYLAGYTYSNEVIIVSFGSEIVFVLEKIVTFSVFFIVFFLLAGEELEYPYILSYMVFILVEAVSFFILIFTTNININPITLFIQFLFSISGLHFGVFFKKYVSKKK